MEINVKNDKTEELFWKIVRNKYLFNFIFEVLGTMPIEYDSVNSYYVGNRLKFKDIKSLEWMVNKNQWEILRDKLQSNQYVYINLEMIFIFIKQCKDESILELMFEKKIKDLRQKNIIDCCVSGGNYIALNFFLSKIEKNPQLLKTVLPIYQSTIKFSIQNSTVQTFESLVKYQPILDESIIIRSLQIASENKSNKIEMINSVKNYLKNLK
ncbi:hypothetical protein RB653_008603 [Dictyostelium firmibasis]|uniref:Uncharacterized protein n=1 Tax=Dictyostelium firmibasis TaxID=79012 RepID=A0AAN7UCW3_9MYCE